MNHREMNRRHYQRQQRQNYIQASLLFLLVLMGVLIAFTIS